MLRPETSRGYESCRGIKGNVKDGKLEIRAAYLQPEQVQLPEEQVQELAEPEQPQSPFILMLVGC